MTLKDLNIGETAVVGTVGGEGALRQHFLDMGLIPGEEVALVKFAPMGDDGAEHPRLRADPPAGRCRPHRGHSGQSPGGEKGGGRK